MSTNWGSVLLKLQLRSLMFLLVILNFELRYSLKYEGVELEFKGTMAKYIWSIRDAAALRTVTFHRKLVNRFRNAYSHSNHVASGLQPSSSPQHSYTDSSTAPQRSSSPHHSYTASSSAPQPSSSQLHSYTKSGISSRVKIGLIAGVIILILLVLALFLQILRQRKRKTSDDMSKQNPEALILQNNLRTLNPQQDVKALIPLKQYSYANVKRITKSFAEVVGQGGFGTVYRGTLCDGRSVAVKILKNSKGNNGEDFINEVSSMSQTSHVNIVTLLGFCSEGSKRAILYEFLENGSLDNFISSKRSSNMDWKKLYEIALGVARGLEYLHHGCRTRIVHFDIKPQNVLLDDNLCPKVSDFGLAKLCEREESILSLLETRGTIGYIAPEVFSKVYGGVSYKSDVYSYGMLVLEMIGARTKTWTEDTSSSTSSMYFPEWIYRDLEKGDNGRLIEDGINNEEEEIVKKMTLVGLWCIQSWPSSRPTMNRVVEMMEGNLNSLELPPRPVLQIPEVPLQESSMTSEDISVYAEEINLLEPITVPSS
ncbi:PREDICTED: glycerophosphodiester phosphodiesterase protein kinase domain-containing GDPDL2-like isoform X1 [Brassica oleracea var. oleracea]|uniref:glycerophosphodiester phosphodiesterase protein kinase domain-containing GDPDL2-like isoform X1 n=1 Tax=Brassica oleracea var. oleracea TaxID=109376 RepID=UPI0006A74ADA|nr:PREDICTED: glycerophosphodiester phosphodiesterase protein kinase domain-containing GDPDL2-like isoform X1 [Brassica oleracea var. oleracea]